MASKVIINGCIAKYKCILDITVCKLTERS